MTATDASAALAAIRAREQAATPGPWGYRFPRKNRIAAARRREIERAERVA